MNIKTTVSGAIAGLCPILNMFIPGVEAICGPVQAIALFFMGLFAKDANPVM